MTAHRSRRDSLVCREALDDGCDHVDAVIQMMTSAGKTVVVSCPVIATAKHRFSQQLHFQVSGMTLLLSLIALCTMNVPNLTAVGASASLSMSAQP